MYLQCTIFLPCHEPRKREGMGVSAWWKIASSKRYQDLLVQIIIAACGHFKLCHHTYTIHALPVGTCTHTIRCIPDQIRVLCFSNQAYCILASTPKTDCYPPKYCRLWLLCLFLFFQPPPPCKANTILIIITNTKVHKTFLRFQKVMQRVAMQAKNIIYFIIKSRWHSHKRMQHFKSKISNTLWNN